MDREYKQVMPTSESAASLLNNDNIFTGKDNDFNTVL